MTHQSSIHWANWAKNHSPILRIVWLAMVGTAVQGESDGHYAAPSIFSRDKYIAPSMKVGKSGPVPLTIFALVTQCIVKGLSRRPKDANVEVEELLSSFAAWVLDRRRTWDLQPIVSTYPS